MTAAAAARPAARAIQVKRSKKPRVVYLSKAEALRRLEKMADLVLADAKVAIELFGVFQGGNEVAFSFRDERGAPIPFVGAHSFNTLQAGALVALAVALARLFDEGSNRYHANARDVASIPLVLRLAQQERCIKALEARARMWTPIAPWMADAHSEGVREALSEATEAYLALRKAPRGRLALRTLRTFRDERLAHSLIRDADTVRSRLGELELLLEVVAKVAAPLRIAVEGNDWSPNDMRRIRAKEMREIWSRGLLKPEVWIGPDKEAVDA